MRVGIVTLGRFGDVCNTLPLLLHEYQCGNKPTLIVSEPWSGITDGISYADRLVWNGPYSNPLAAKSWAAGLRRFGDILVPQCYGQKFVRQCDNFCEEAWRLAGLRELWGTIPLLFDRRNKEREKQHIPQTDKPIILVCSDGISHPFPYRQELLETVGTLRSAHEIVDMSQVKAHRFYDILGLMERAKCLVTIDTGILHLARAVPSLPVITIIPGNDTTWDVAPRLKEHIARIYFDEFKSRKNEIFGLITDASRPPNIFHVWSDYPRHDPGAIHRHTIAKMTWKNIATAAWKEMPLRDKHFTRSSFSDYGDVKTLPYVTDMINVAVAKMNQQDIVLLTNDDTCLSPGIDKTIMDAVTQCEAIWSARREHRRIMAPLEQSKIMTGRKHVGADVFAFTKEWWLKYGHEMPDMFMSLENWDYVLRTIIMKHGGAELEGICYHEIHRGAWLKNREVPEAKHNQQMSESFFAAAA